MVGDATTAKVGGHDTPKLRTDGALFRIEVFIGLDPTLMDLRLHRIRQMSYFIRRVKPALNPSAHSMRGMMLSSSSSGHSTTVFR